MKTDAAKILEERKIKEAAANLATNTKIIYDAMKVKFDDAHATYFTTEWFKMVISGSVATNKLVHNQNLPGVSKMLNDILKKKDDGDNKK